MRFFYNYLVKNSIWRKMLFSGKIYSNNIKHIKRRNKPYE
jgi:hypothetical protein